MGGINPFSSQCVANGYNEKIASFYEGSYKAPDGTTVSASDQSGKINVFQNNLGNTCVEALKAEISVPPKGTTQVVGDENNIKLGKGSKLVLEDARKNTIFGSCNKKGEPESAVISGENAFWNKGPKSNPDFCQ